MFRQLGIFQSFSSTEQVSVVRQDQTTGNLQVVCHKTSLADYHVASKIIHEAYSFYCTNEYSFSKLVFEHNNCDFPVEIKTTACLLTED